MPGATHVWPAAIVVSDVATFNATFPDDAGKHIRLEGDGDTAITLRRDAESVALFN